MYADYFKNPHIFLKLNLRCIYITQIGNAKLFPYFSLSKLEGIRTVSLCALLYFDQAVSSQKLKKYMKHASYGSFWKFSGKNILQNVVFLSFLGINDQGRSFDGLSAWIFDCYQQIIFKSRNTKIARKFNLPKQPNN